MKTQRKELSFAPSRLGDPALNASDRHPAPAGQKTIVQGNALGSVPGDAQSPGWAEDGEWPEGWRLLTLGEATGMKQGEVLGTHEMKTSGFPVFGANGRIGYYHRFTHRDSEVLVTCRGSTCGTVNISPPQSFITNNAMVVTPLNSAALERSFLALALQVADLSSTITGTGQPQITKGKLARVAIRVPPLPEQKATASVLRTVQEAREACERVLAATRQLKQSLLHHLFTYGPVPFPQAAHVLLKETEIGSMPEHWQTAELGDFTLHSAFGPRFGGELYDHAGNVATLRTTDISDDGRINYATMPRARITEERFRSHFLNKGDFLVTRSGTCGIASVFERFGSPVLAGAFLIRFVLKDVLSPYFLRDYFNSPIGRPRVESIASGAVQKNISGTSLKAFVVPVPSLSEQREIAAQLSAVDAKLAAEESRRAALAVLFQSLLHGLMTGRLRLPGFARGAA